MSSGCLIEIILDKPTSYYYTNLDKIKGRVVVKVLKPITVTNIQIKLEGTSKTLIWKTIRLATGETQTKFGEEAHNLVYDCDTLFPPDNVKKVTKNSDGFTLSPQTYEYGFEFQLPMNCFCGDIGSIQQFSNIYNSRAEQYAVTSTKAAKIHRRQNGEPDFQHGIKVDHQRCPLPPSTRGELDSKNSFKVQYFLKATVRRASMLKVNNRLVVPLNFTNFDPSDAVIERYLQTAPERRNRSKKYILTRMNTRANYSNELSGESNKIQRDFLSDNAFMKVPVFVDINFPCKVLRPNYPFSIQMKLLTPHPHQNFRLPESTSSNGQGVVFIRSFSITLVRNFAYKALTVCETLNKPIKLQNLKQPLKLDFANSQLNPEGLYEIEFPPALFEKIIIPSNLDLPPSFRTCNMNNTYTISINLTLSMDMDNNRQCTELVDFMTDVWLLSGIPASFPLESSNQEYFTSPPPPIDPLSFFYSNPTESLHPPSTGPPNHGAPPFPPRPGSTDSQTSTQKLHNYSTHSSVGTSANAGMGNNSSSTNVSSSAASMPHDSHDGHEKIDEELPSYFEATNYR